MKKSTRWILNSILILALLFGLFRFAQSVYEGHLSRKNYESAFAIATGQNNSATAETTENPTTETQEPIDSSVEPIESNPIPDDPYIQELLELNLDALRQENEDVIGWIYIPDSQISFPLLQWTDNEFYLSHSWQQTPNPAGSIFMEWQNNPDLSDFNTIIYGHRMKGQNMFGSLQLYKDPEYLAAHPHIYLLVDSGVYRYDVFAVQYAKLDAIIYGLGIETDQRKAELIRYSLDYSLVETDVIPTTEDRILTLSTCSGYTYINRWVVQSVLNKEGSYIFDP